MPQTRISEETRARVAKIWPSIIDGLAAGEQVRDVLALANVSLNVARAYMDSTPGARDEWNTAKADSADAYFDRVVAIANNPGPDPQSARVQADMFRWLAGKRNPRDYSDKAQLDVNVRTVDLTRIISDAQARLEASRAVGNAALLGAIDGQAQRMLVDTGAVSD